MDDAILLFGKDQQKIFISSEVKCGQFYGNVVEKPIPSLQIYKGDVFELIDQATWFYYAIALRATQIDPKHPLIAEPMQRCGYIEKTGTGTGDIVKQRLEYGLKVIIWQPGTQELFEQVIIRLIKINPKISRKDLAEALHTSPRTIARRIKQMGDKIHFVGSGYSGHWERTTAQQ